MAPGLGCRVLVFVDGFKSCLLGTDFDVVVEHAEDAVFGDDDDGLAGMGRPTRRRWPSTCVMPSTGIFRMPRAGLGGGCRQ